MLSCVEAHPFAPFLVRIGALWCFFHFGRHTISVPCQLAFTYIVPCGDLDRFRLPTCQRAWACKDRLQFAEIVVRERLGVKCSWFDDL